MLYTYVRRKNPNLLIFPFWWIKLLFQLHEEDDVSDWEEGEATDEALEVSRRMPFAEFGGNIAHHTGKYYTVTAQQ